MNILSKITWTGSLFDGKSPSNKSGLKLSSQNNIFGKRFGGLCQSAKAAGVTKLKSIYHNFNGKIKG